MSILKFKKKVFLTGFQIPLGILLKIYIKNHESDQR